MLSRPGLKAPEIAILRDSLRNAESALLEGCIASIIADYHSEREYQSLAEGWNPIGYLSDLTGASENDFRHLNNEIVEQTIGRHVFDIEDTFESYGRPLSLYVRWLEQFPTWKSNKLQRLWADEVPQSVRREKEFERSIYLAFATNDDDDQLLSAISDLLQEYPNPMGRRYAAWQISMVEGAGFTAYYRMTELRALAVIATIRLRLLENGSVPMVLSELVQADFPDLNLTDPFSGNQFIYSRQRLSLWSAGKDRFDDGGTFEDVRIVSPDFVWSVDDRFAGIRSH